MKVAAAFAEELALAPSTPRCIRRTILLMDPIVPSRAPTMISTISQAPRKQAPNVRRGLQLAGLAASCREASAFEEGPVGVGRRMRKPPQLCEGYGRVG